MEISDDQTKTIDNKNGDQKMYPASMTKLLTVYVAVNKLSDYDKMITIMPEDVDGLFGAGASLAGFRPGELMSVDDLLHGILLPSGAEAIRALARIISGSEEKYVKLMNKTAKEIGMINSNFKNTTGLHDVDHYTTTNDLALLMEKALENEKLKEMISTMEYDMAPNNIHKNGLKFKNTIVDYSRISGNAIGLIDGGKTGWTPQAGYCLVSYSKFNDKTVIIATGKGQYSGVQLLDHNLLYDKLLNQKHKIDIFKKGDELGKINIKNGKGLNELFLIAPDDISVEVPNILNKDDLEILVDYPKSLDATIKEDTKLASLKVTYNDEILYDYEFVSEENIERSTFKYLLNMLLKGATYIAIGFVLIFMYLVYNYKSKRVKRA